MKVKKPAENGRKASLLRNRPSESKKCSGLKMSGVSHSLLSVSTDPIIEVTVVPWKKDINFICVAIICFTARSSGLQPELCTLGMKNPAKVVSLLAILGNPKGTTFPILWHS